MMLRCIWKRYITCISYNYVFEARICGESKNSRFRVSLEALWECNLTRFDLFNVLLD